MTDILNNDKSKLTILRRILLPQEIPLYIHLNKRADFIFPFLIYLLISIWIFN